MSEMNASLRFLRVWQHWMERSGIDRNPVSPTRLRAGIALLIAIALAMSWYLLTTRDAAIRRRAVTFLQEISSGEVQVGAAQFRMFGGITLQDVYIATPFSAALDPSAISPMQREIFSARTLHLQHNPWLLLLGQFRIEEIVAVQPRITLTHNADTQMRNWQLLAQASTETIRKPGSGNRPSIRVRAAKAVLVSLHAGSTPESRIEELDADVRPYPHSASGYYIEIRRYSDPAERVTVLFDPASRLVTNTPFVDARTIRLQLPWAAQQFFDHIQLQGEVKLSRLVYDPAGTGDRESEIKLRKVQCRLPLSLIRSGNTRDETSAAPQREAPDAFVTMTDIEGSLKLRRERLDIQIAGMVNGGTCRLEGILQSFDGPLDQIGFNVRLIGLDVPAPEGAMRTMLLEDPAVPKDLQVIFEDYDPHGPFNFDFQLSRSAGPGGHITMSGVLEPNGAHAMSRMFAYPIRELTGRVRFEGTTVYIEGLRGRHKGAEISFEGHVDQSRPWSEVHVDIEGRDVPLDGALYSALRRRHQNAWMRFTPRGATDLSIELRRAGGGSDVPSPPYETHVTALLKGSEISLREGQYWLSDVRGRLEMNEDRIELHDMTGRHDEGTIGINGFATIPEEGEPEMDLCIEGRHIPLNEELLAVLPEEERDVLAQFRPEGYFDLTGAVRRIGSAPDVEYEIDASVFGASANHALFPYGFSDVHGGVRVSNNAVVVRRLLARHGPASFDLWGDLRRADGVSTGDVNLVCRHVPIDSKLYQAIPPRLQKTWHMFEPQGTAHLTSNVHFEADADQTRLRQRGQLLFEGGSALFSKFPLPMKNINAEFSFDDDSAEIIRFDCDAGGGRLSMHGAVELGIDRPAGLLNVSARNIFFGETLCRALPEALGRRLRGINARGRFDLSLIPLRFEPDENGHYQWDFSGRMRLINAAASLGMDVRHASGELSGNGGLDSGGGVDLNLAASLNRARLAGWDLERINAQLVLPRSASRLEIRDGIADAYGGEVAGSAQIDLGRESSSYRGSITVRDVRLDRYLEKGSQIDGAGPTGPTAKGKLSGSMFIRGRTGLNSYREGAGEMYIRSAQVWKLPLVLAIFQVLNLTPDENVFHDGHLQYYLTDDLLTFSQIDLQGKAVSFIGGGTMDLTTRGLDVTLLAGSPLRLKIPFLSELMEKASREFMEVRILGTLDQPVIKPQPLKSLKKTLDAIFRPPPKSSHRVTPARPGR